MNKQVLIVSKDEDFCKKLQFVFSENNINIRYRESISEKIDDSCILSCDLIIVELSCFDARLLEKIRKILLKRPVPIMIVHSELSDVEAVRLYDAGAVTLLHKSIPSEICVAQAQSLIHLYSLSNNLAEPSALVFGTDLVIDPLCRLVKIDGKILNLTRREFDIFHCLAQHKGQVLTYKHLYEEIWREYADEKKMETVKVQICTLRKKLSDVGKNYIRNGSVK